MTTQVQWLGAICFGLAIVHTFLAPSLHRLSYRFGSRSWKRRGLLLVGEVETSFAIWGVLFLILWGAISRGAREPALYLGSVSFLEPLFVFFILIVAASRPIVGAAEFLLRGLARLVPLPRAMAEAFVLLSVGPLFGSFITEPAAMTVVALLLKPMIFDRPLSLRFKYATLAVLFVNISIGGVLTSYAAPPVLMVAERFGWNTPFMFFEFGWRAILAVVTNAFLLVVFFRKELTRAGNASSRARANDWMLSLVHGVFLGGLVVLAHSPRAMSAWFIGFVVFWAITKTQQVPLRIKEATMVALFLAGLVCLGGAQGWWLSPILSGLGADALYYSTALLTAVTDNAALTYLGAQVPGLSELAKEALVAGAVTGGGLTVIANAPNPAGFTILESGFGAQGFNAAKLFVLAVPPTFVAVFWFWWF